MPVRKTASPALKLVVVVIGLGLVALVVHTMFGEGGYFDLQKRRTELEEMRQRIERLEEENRRLTEEVKALKSDPQAIEQVAREQLKMAKPGETVISLPEKKEAAKNPPD